jgi:hypothetical protein
LRLRLDAAKELSRDYLGIEIDPGDHATAMRRLAVTQRGTP